MSRFVRLVAFVLVALASMPAGNAGEPVRKTRPLSVSGRALDSEGTPIRGGDFPRVDERHLRTAAGQATSDEDGRYAFRELPLPIPVPGRVARISNMAAFECWAARRDTRVPGGPRSICFSIRGSNSIRRHAPADFIRVKTSCST